MVAEGKDMSCNCLTQIQLYDETQAQINQAGFQNLFHVSDRAVVRWQLYDHVINTKRHQASAIKNCAKIENQNRAILHVCIPSHLSSAKRFKLFLVTFFHNDSSNMTHEHLVI